MSIDALLAQYRLKRHPVRADGNCLFHALSLFFSDVSAMEMRQQCVRYVSEHAEDFEPDISALYECSVPVYCSRMLRPGFFGDAVILQAFTLAFPVTVYLFMPTGLTQFGSGSRNVALIRAGEHYDAAVPVA